ncbi:hypothetical protein A3218_02055 [Pseudomonas chlororaphis]|uniref:hypothetical protein n=1 Tax=Pseudomonas chlororaphis TaxID=587753 RepID=UPI000789E5BC|nr:hypothetical protein [Pseudomonas chlororaphis]AMS13154.1 hypothetical protein A3218_02055 [Pseudomonas chlororaphis]
MEPRYKVKRRISVEIGGAKGGLRTSTSSPPGFSVYDTLEKKNLPEFYSSHADAEAHRDRLNKDQKMLKLTDSNRAFLNEIRALNADEHGREIFVGLTREESERYLALSEADKDLSTKERDEYIKLDEQYNRARMQVIGAEHLLRTENPPIH